jgi:hypothetical protein
MSTYEYLLKKYGTTLTFQEASEEIGLYWQTIREMCARAPHPGLAEVGVKAPKRGQGRYRHKPPHGGCGMRWDG